MTTARLDGESVSHLPKHSEAPTGGMGFHTTQWTLILEAGAGDRTRTREALASLCAAYWYPLYAYIRRRGWTPHDAEDLTQEFFRQFLERNAFASVRPGAGKFRSFLLTCLKNFLCNEQEHAAAQRRGGGCVLLPLDISDADTRGILRDGGGRFAGRIRQDPAESDSQQRTRSTSHEGREARGEGKTHAKTPRHQENVSTKHRKMTERRRDRMLVGRYLLEQPLLEAAESGRIRQEAVNAEGF